MRPAERRALGARGLLACAMLASLLGGLAAACTEDPLGSPPGGTPPGATSPTLEFIIDVQTLDSWRDTTFSGFATSSSASFLEVSDTPELEARALGVFAVPDTVESSGDTLPADTYTEADILISVDSPPDEFVDYPIPLRLVDLVRGFDAPTATWSKAGAGDPWDTPGGDLGDLLATGEMAANADSIILQFEAGIEIDSLMKAWRDTHGEPGFALLVGKEGVRLRIRQILLRYQAILEGRELPIGSQIVISPRTFIHDPPLPPIGVALRLGGLPSSRIYLTFLPPDTIDGVPVRGSMINHAELRFRPLVVQAEPFGLERALFARPTQLAADPFVFGEKTPVGEASAELVVIDSVAVREGQLLRVNITDPMTLFARLPADSVAELRLGIRPEPDAQTFGFAEFGSIEAPPGFRPELLIVLTPPLDFRLP